MSPRTKLGIVLIVVLVIAIVLVGCGVSSSSDGVHWRGRGERSIEVRLGPSVHDPLVALALVEASRLWSEATPWIELRVEWGTCQPGVDCVDVGQQPMNGASATIAWDSTLHMFERAAVLWFDSAPWTWEVVLNGGCHELGHALALKHSPVPGVPGPCWNGAPTPYDVRLVDAAHGHDDVSGGILLGEPGKADSQVFTDTRDELEAGS